MFEDRRISAGELQDRYELKHDLFDFYDSMHAEIWRHWEDKGASYKTCKISYLRSQLVKHINKQDWVSVANLAFFLNLRPRKFGASKKKGASK